MAKKHTVDCSQVEAITKISGQLNKIEKTVYGNGNSGLTTLIQGVVDSLNLFGKSVEDMQTDVKVLLRFQTQIETREKERIAHKDELRTIKQERGMEKRWKTGLTITTMLSLTAVVVSLIYIIVIIKSKL